VAYFTQAELEAYIGETVSVEDYTKAEKFARQFIERYTGQIFELGTYSEIRKVDDTIPLSKYPVVSVTSVKVLPDETVLDDYLYFVYDWGIELIQPMRGLQVKVEYTAGWSEMPEPIKEVALWLAKRLLVPLDKPTPTAQSISTGGTSISFLNADPDNGRPTDDDWVNSILNQYRREKAW